jgi:N-acyl-D-aspartate/D-glutamate deacylase
MTAVFDRVVRGGTVLDGTGADLVEADVAVRAEATGTLPGRLVRGAQAGCP